MSPYYLSYLSLLSPNNCSISTSSPLTTVPSLPPVPLTTVPSLSHVPYYLSYLCSANIKLSSCPPPWPVPQLQWIVGQPHPPLLSTGQISVVPGFASEQPNTVHTTQSPGNWAQIAWGIWECMSWATSSRADILGHIKTAIQSTVKGHLEKKRSSKNGVFVSKNSCSEWHSGR